MSIHLYDPEIGFFEPDSVWTTDDGDTIVNVNIKHVWAQWLRGVPSEARSEQSRINGKTGGRPKGRKDSKPRKRRLSP